MDGDPFDPEAIGLAMAPSERTAMRWMLANGGYRERKHEGIPNAQALWQLCHWRVYDGTLAPLIEGRDKGDDPFLLGSQFRMTALGTKVHAALTREGETPFSWQPDKSKSRKRRRKPYRKA